jgi:hypothetical protein
MPFQQVTGTYADDYIVVMGKPAEDGWTEPHWAVEFYNMNATSLVLSRHATQQEAEQQAADVRTMLLDVIDQETI